MPQIYMQRGDFAVATLIATQCGLAALIRDGQDATQKVWLHVSPADPDGAEKRASVLRTWLGYMDAIRWSTADMELPLLSHASVEHLGYSG